MTHTATATDAGGHQGDAGREQQPAGRSACRLDTGRPDRRREVGDEWPGDHRGSDGAGRDGPWSGGGDGVGLTPGAEPQPGGWIGSVISGGGRHGAGGGPAGGPPGWPPGAPYPGVP